MFFNRKTTDPKPAEDAEVLRAEIQDLKNELATLKHEKKIAEEDIKHMIRLREERLEVEAEKKQLEREREKQDAIAAVKDQYRDKLEKRLQTEVDNIKAMYAQILERLPKVSVRQMDVHESTNRRDD